MAYSFVANSAPSSQEMTRLAGGINASYFINGAGGVVTPSSGMVLAVSAIAAQDVVANSVRGTTAYAGSTVTVSTSDPDHPRRDWVYYDVSDGSCGVTPGAAAVAPVLPNLTASRIGLAEVAVAAGATTISSGNITDRRLSIPAVIRKYKSATQTISASTTYADMIAVGSPATMTFMIGASQIWAVEYFLPLTFTSTGGLKLQITGPTSPTAVAIMPYLPVFGGTGGNITYVGWEAATTAFSTDFAKLAAAAGSGDGSYTTTRNGGHLRVVALIVNGSTAGAVTLQVAQNSAAGTTVIGIGAYMRAEQVA